MILVQVMDAILVDFILQHAHVLGLCTLSLLFVHVQPVLEVLDAILQTVQEEIAEQTLLLGLVVGRVLLPIFVLQAVPVNSPLLSVETECVKQVKLVMMEILIMEMDVLLRVLLRVDILVLVHLAHVLYV